MQCILIYLLIASSDRKVQEYLPIAPPNHSIALSINVRHIEAPAFRSAFRSDVRSAFRETALQHAERQSAERHGAVRDRHGQHVQHVRHVNAHNNIA